MNDPKYELISTYNHIFINNGIILNILNTNIYDKNEILIYINQNMDDLYLNTIEIKKDNIYIERELITKNVVKIFVVSFVHDIKECYFESNGDKYLKIDVMKNNWESLIKLWKEDMDLHKRLKREINLFDIKINKYNLTNDHKLSEEISFNRKRIKNIGEIKNILIEIDNIWMTYSYNEDKIKNDNYGLEFDIYSPFCDLALNYSTDEQGNDPVIDEIVVLLLIKKIWLSDDRIIYIYYYFIIIIK